MHKKDIDTDDFADAMEDVFDKDSWLRMHFTEESLSSLRSALERALDEVYYLQRAYFK